MKREAPPSGLPIYYSSTIPEMYDGWMCGVKVLVWNKWDKVWQSPVHRTLWKDWKLESYAPTIWVIRSIDLVERYLSFYPVARSFLTLMDGVDVWDTVYLATRAKIVMEYQYVQE